MRLRWAVIGLLVACSGDQNRVARDGASEPRRDAAGVAVAPADYKLAAVDAKGRVADSGDVIVIVSWPAPPAAAIGSPGRNACGAASRAAVDMFIRDKQETVTALRYAIVELVGIERGRALEPAAPVEVAVRDCRLHPVVARLPRLGSALAVINDDERRHELVVEHLGDGTGSPESLARVPLPLVGQRFELPLDRAGIVRITTGSDERDHVYVAVPAHPYVALPDASGVARLEQVPAGRHHIRVWHPPLERAGKPLIATATVTVEPGKSVEQVITIEP